MSIFSPAGFRCRTAESGFTLVEVVVAVAVAALLLTTLMHALGAGVTSATRLRAESGAAIFAQSALDALGSVSPLRDGDSADFASGPYRLHVTVDRDGQPLGYVALYRLVATVRWQESSLSFTTLRLGPNG